MHGSFLGAEPFPGAPVHPLGFRRGPNGFAEVGTGAEAVPDRADLLILAVFRRGMLAGIGEPGTVPTPDPRAHDIQHRQPASTPRAAQPRPRAAIAHGVQSRGIRWRSRPQGSTARLPASRSRPAGEAARPGRRRTSAPGHPDTPAVAAAAHPGARACEGHALGPPLPLARAITTHIVPLRVFFVEIIKKLSHTPPREGQ